VRGRWDSSPFSSKIATLQVVCVNANNKCASRFLLFPKNFCKQNFFGSPICVKVGAKDMVRGNPSSVSQHSCLLLAACKGDRRLGHRGRSYHAPAPLRALFSSNYAVLIPCARLSPQGEGGEAPYLFGQVPCRGRGFAPYPMIPHCHPDRTKAHTVIPTERSERRDPQERTRGQGRPSSVGRRSRSDTFPPRGRQGGSVPFRASAMSWKGLRPLPPPFLSSRPNEVSGGIPKKERVLSWGFLASLEMT